MKRISAGREKSYSGELVSMAAEALDLVGDILDRYGSQLPGSDRNILENALDVFDDIRNQR